MLHNSAWTAAGSQLAKGGGSHKGSAFGLTTAMPRNQPYDPLLDSDNGVMTHQLI